MVNLYLLRVVQLMDRALVLYGLMIWLVLVLSQHCLTVSIWDLEIIIVAITKMLVLCVKVTSIYNRLLQ